MQSVVGPRTGNYWSLPLTLPPYPAFINIPMIGFSDVTPLPPFRPSHSRDATPNGSADTRFTDYMGSSTALATTPRKMCFKNSSTTFFVYCCLKKFNPECFEFVTFLRLLERLKINRKQLLLITQGFY